MADAHWQLNGSAPELYQRYLVPAITAKWADDLIDRTKPQSGEAVLDVACGTGVVARTAAARMVKGRVTGLDLNPGMLAVAMTMPAHGPSINWVEGSALDLPFADAAFDLVLCQLGLQFFPDQPRALREIRRVVKPLGRIGVSVYSPIERTPGANAFVIALDHILGPEASTIKRGEHSFAAPGELRSLLASEGLSSVDVATVVHGIVFPSVLDYVRFQLLATPMASLLGRNADGDRDMIIEKVAAETARLSDPEMLDGGRFSFHQEAYVGTARNA